MEILHFAIIKNRTMRNKLLTLFVFVPVIACTRAPLTLPDPVVANPSLDFSRRGLAGMLSRLPLEADHLLEVYQAVNSSSENGYDEEYTMEDLVSNPGAGVGSPHTKAVSPPNPIRDLFGKYFEGMCATKSDGGVEEYMEMLKSSGLQIYWPYSEMWDGETFPLITFDPGYGAESNYAYVISPGEGGLELGDSVLVDETVAMQRPVWVVNTNEDSSFSPREFFSGVKSGSAERRLVLKSMKMLRNYDSWFGGASEFVVQCGAVDGFKANTEDELKLYYPTITTFSVVVRRSQRGEEVPLDALLLTDFTDQTDKLAFLLTEDDGGTRTSWKCSATVKLKSKSYGFDIDLPYSDRDDIVWRGQLSSGFFLSSEQVTDRFGDVIVTFALL